MAQPRFFQAENNASSESKSQNITIPSAQHWINLQTRVDQFNALEMKADHPYDEMRYQQVNVTMAEIIKHGKRGEYSDFLEKISRIDNAISEHRLFGDGLCPLPTPAGAKSLAYIQAVYLPYLKDSQYVTFTSDSYIGQTILYGYSYLNQIFFKRQIGALSEIIDRFREIYTEARIKTDAVIDKIMPAITRESPSIVNNKENTPRLSK